MLDYILDLFGGGKKASTPKELAEMAANHAQNIKFIVDEILRQFVDGPMARTKDGNKIKLHLMALGSASAHVMAFCIGSLGEAKYGFSEKFIAEYKKSTLAEFENLLEKYREQIKVLEKEIAQPLKAVNLDLPPKTDI